MRIAIRVRPAAARPGVGGAYGAALVVRVSAPAVEGKATEAALRALAAAFGVARRDVTLVAGATARDKIVEIIGDEEELNGRLAALRDG